LTLSSRTVRRSVTWVVGGAGATVFAITNAPAMQSLGGAVSHISPGVAVAGMALSRVAILNRAGLNRAAHNVVGLPAEPLSMIRPAAAGFAANKILRSGGMAGAAMFVRHGDALAAAGHNPRWALRAAFHALSDKALGATMLLCAVTAVSHHLGPTDVIVIYAAALATSMVSLVPAGVGVVEASTGALLVATGAPLSIAALAVGLFRVFDIWIPVAAGALAARAPRTVKAADIPPAPLVPPATEGEPVAA